MPLPSYCWLHTLKLGMTGMTSLSMLYPLYVVHTNVGIFKPNIKTFTWPVDFDFAASIFGIYNPQNFISIGIFNLESEYPFNLFYQSFSIIFQSFGNTVKNGSGFESFHSRIKQYKIIYNPIEQKGSRSESRKSWKFDMIEIFERVYPFEIACSILDFYQKYLAFRHVTLFTLIVQCHLTKNLFTKKNP